MHQYDDQLVRTVQSQTVQCSLKPCHMAEVVRSPDINGLCESALKLIAVICYVCRKISIETVGSLKHIVLKIQVLDLLGSLSVPCVFIYQKLCGLKPQCAVLFVCKPLINELLYRICHLSRFVQCRLKEPGIISNPVLLKVFLHLGDIPLKAEVCHVVESGFLFHIQKLLAALVVDRLCQLLYIIALIAVIGELKAILPVDQLHISSVYRYGKLVNLVSGVIYIEFF